MLAAPFGGDDRMLNDSPYCSRVPEVIADRVRYMGVTQAIASLGIEANNIGGVWTVSFSSDFGPAGDAPSHTALLMWARVLLGLD